MSERIATYVDYADFYDLDHAGPADLEFYREYCEIAGPRVLELACGTGRLLVPLAESGVEIDGLDFADNMLTVCRRKLNVAGVSNRVDLFRQDMAAFGLPRRDYSLIFIPVRSFMHLFTQEAQLACLRRCHDHLRANGTFIVDVYAPSCRAMSQSPDSPFTDTMEYTLPNGHHVVRSDRFVKNEPVAQIQFCERRFREYSGDALVRELVVPLDTRYSFRYELQLLMEKAGFVVADVFGDYDRRPFDGRGEIIVVARKGR